jgi:hypothetical protein
LPLVENGEEVVFEGAEFAVGDDEEVAAAAGGIKEFQAGELGVEFFEGGAVGAGLAAFFVEVVEEERADDLEDVGLGGVVRADLPAGAGFHDALEERAEDGGGDARPVEAGGVEEGVTHGGVEMGDGQRFGEEAAVDVGQAGEGFDEVFWRCSRGGARVSKNSARRGPRSLPSGADSWTRRSKALESKMPVSLAKRQKRRRTRKTWRRWSG